MTRSIIVDIYDDEVLKILRNMETQNKIKLHNDHIILEQVNWPSEFKGALKSDKIEDIDSQLNGLRNGWE